MNCSDVRAWLAIHHEYEQNPTDTTALEEHLEDCDACKDAYAQMQFVRESIRSMPRVAPSPDAHAKLMQALAAEHVRFLQRTSSSASATPTPAFLVPYLKHVAHKSSGKESLVAFTTADTGPLPIIRRQKPHRTKPIQHVGILGIAAAILVMLMGGGVLSLLVLSSQSGQTSTVLVNVNTEANISHPTLLNIASYTTNASYPHIASAVTQNETIYYTAYSNDGSSWMLEQMDTKNNSTPLLALPRTKPMVVLGMSGNWLFWLQMDETSSSSKTSNQNKAANKDTNTTSTKTVSAISQDKLAGSWSLRALDLTKKVTPDTTATTNTNGSSDTSSSSTTTSLSSDSGQTDSEVTNSITLLQDTFNPNVSPDWIDNPIQGFELQNNSLLLSFIDNKGISHLTSYALEQDTIDTPVQITVGAKGHIITSLTSNTDGSVIFWADEWMQDTHQLASDIWTQQIISAPPFKEGRWAPHNETEMYLYLGDGNSFRPQLVNDTLFVLSRTSGGIEPQTDLPTPGVTPTVQPTISTTTTPATATGTVQATVTATPEPVILPGVLGGDTRVDSAISEQPLDETVVGNIQAFTDNGAIPEQTPIANKASDIQGGTQFLIWQDASHGNFAMYDEQANTQVTITENDIPKDAIFMTVNGDTALWARYVNPSTSNANPTNTPVTFGSFRWPPDGKSYVGN